MKVTPPDYKERRGQSVLLLWGAAPFWMVVDTQAAKFIDALCAGTKPAEALRKTAGRAVDLALERDAAAIVARLKDAGVIGNRRLPPPKERIESVTVNVTNRCNLRCRFCYNQAQEHGCDEICAEEMIRSLESVRRWTTRGATLALLGGEPLMQKEKTLALAEWGQRRGLKPIVSTNGLLVDERFAGQAAEVGLECQVSLDGSHPATHEAIRGRGAFERTLKGVRTLVEAGAHTVLSMVVHSENVDDLAAYLRLADNLGVREARFIPVKKAGRGVSFEVPNLAEVIRSLADVISREPRLLKLLGRDYVSILAQTCHACSARQSCGAGSQTFLLDADGTIYPCPNLVSTALAAGNVRREPIKQIWFHSPALARVREQTLVTALDEECACCFLRHWCMGGCRGETYENTGRLNARSVTCAQIKPAILEMFWTLTQHPELRRNGEQLFC